MTRRTLLALPVLAPLAKLLGAKPESAAEPVPDALRFLREIGCPDGWVPARYCGQWFAEVRDSRGCLTSSIGVFFDPPEPTQPVSTGVVDQYQLQSFGGMRGFAEKLNRARIFAEARRSGYQQFAAMRREQVYG